MLTVDIKDSSSGLVRDARLHAIAMYGTQGQVNSTHNLRLRALSLCEPLHFRDFGGGHLEGLWTGTENGVDGLGPESGARGRLARCQIAAIGDHAVPRRGLRSQPPNGNDNNKSSAAPSKHADLKSDGDAASSRHRRCAGDFRDR